MKNIFYLRNAIKTDCDLASKAAASLNMSKTELSSKLMRPGKFTMGQVLVLKKLFSLSTEETVFIFAPAVAHSN